MITSTMALEHLNRDESLRMIRYRTKRTERGKQVPAEFRTSPFPIRTLPAVVTQ